MSGRELSREALSHQRVRPNLKHVKGIRKAATVVLPIFVGLLLLAVCVHVLFSTDRTTQAQPNPTGTSWLLLATGSVAPSPSASFTPRASATATLPATPSASATPTRSGDPCRGAEFRAGQINGADVTAGSTSAVVKWFNPGSPSLVDFHILAVSQHLVYGRQPEIPGWVTVKSNGCGWMTGVVTGLTPGTPYIFSVDGMWTGMGVDGTHTRTVARSKVVTTALA
ncbi:hypothetical protein Areg01_56100 [Actinoplanes regularis]|nr:hypothetical protein Areg01_56100 [Actinoplanes regularis]